MKLLVLVVLDLLNELARGDYVLHLLPVQLVGANDVHGLLRVAQQKQDALKDVRELQHPVAAQQSDLLPDGLAPDLVLVKLELQLQVGLLVQLLIVLELLQLRQFGFVLQELLNVVLQQTLAHLPPGLFEKLHEVHQGAPLLRLDLPVLAHGVHAHHVP